MPSSICSMMDCVSNENLCRSCILTHKLRFFWTVANFNHVEAIGKIITSPKFSSLGKDEFKWHLTLYPKEKNNAISIFLNISSDSKKNQDVCIFAQYTISLLSDKHEIPYAKRCENTVSCFTTSDNGSKGKKTLKFTENVAWGWNEFITKDDVFRKEWLVNNTLTICCELAFSTEKDAITTVVHHQCKCTPFQHLSDNLGSVLDNEEFTDVTFFVKGKKFRAHKAILAGRSIVFSEMFKRNVEKNENTINITDTSDKVFASLLRYVYTGKCHNLKEVAAELIVAADKYDLMRLKLMCADALHNSISIQNAVDVLVLADSYGISELKHKAIEFIITKSAEVMKSTRWKSIHLSKPELLHEVCQALSRRMETSCKLV